MTELHGSTAAPTARTAAGNGRRRAAIALAALSLATVARAAPGDERPTRWWLDLGVGVGEMDAAAAPSGTRAVGAAIDVTAGGRISEHWMLGLNLGGVGTGLSRGNYDPANAYSSIYGQTVTNVFVSAQHQPRGAGGWTFGFAAGQVLYHNRDIEALTGSYRSGTGGGVSASVGYARRTGEHGHIETRLALEQGRVGLGAPLAGRFNLTAVSLTVHLAYH